MKVRENVVREMKGKRGEREEGSRQTPVVLLFSPTPSSCLRLCRHGLHANSEKHRLNAGFRHVHGGQASSRSHGLPREKCFLRATLWPRNQTAKTTIPFSVL